MSAARLVCRPITQRAAFAWVGREHKHLPPPAGQNGLTAEVSRAASPKTHEPVPHAASKALAAITRAALALGYTRLVSYTREDEKGTTYRAAGWRPTAIVDGGEWSRPSRSRKAAVQPCRKVRWEYGPDAAPGIDVELPLAPLPPKQLALAATEAA